MKTLPLLAGVLLLGTVAAQEPAQSDTKATAEQRKQELQDLRKKAVKDWRDSIKQAREAKDGQPRRAMRMRPDYGPVAVKAMAFAKEFAGQDAAIEFLLQAIELDGKQAKPAIEVLIRDHVDSPKLASMGNTILSLGNHVTPEVAQDVLGKLAKSKSAAVRGWATLAQHRATIVEGDLDSDAFKAARGKLSAIADSGVDAKLSRQITRMIVEREKLGIGVTAMDIEGVDLDGVAFKLSDYKGKVIFLDFWGDW